MMTLDSYWTTNRDWWYREESGAKIIKPDVPKEAQESYKRYLEQISRSPNAI